MLVPAFNIEGARIVTQAFLHLHQVALKFFCIMVYTGDFALCYYVGFLQISSQLLSLPALSMPNEKAFKQLVRVLHGHYNGDLQQIFI